MKTLVLILGLSLAWGAPQASPPDKLKQWVGTGSYQELLAYRQNPKTVKNRSQWTQVFSQARQRGQKLTPPLSARHEAL